MVSKVNQVRLHPGWVGRPIEILLSRSTRRACNTMEELIWRAVNPRFPYMKVSMPSTSLSSVGVQWIATFRYIEMARGEGRDGVWEWGWVGGGDLGLKRSQHPTFIRLHTALSIIDGPLMPGFCLRDNSLSAMSFIQIIDLLDKSLDGPSHTRLPISVIFSHAEVLLRLSRGHLCPSVPPSRWCLVWQFFLLLIRLSLPLTVGW